MDLNKELTNFLNSKKQNILGLIKIVQKAREYLFDKYEILITKDNEILNVLRYCVDKWGNVPVDFDWESIVLKKVINKDYIDYLAKQNIPYYSNFNIDNKGIQNHNNIVDIAKDQIEKWKIKNSPPLVIKVQGSMIDWYDSNFDPIKFIEIEKLRKDMKYFDHIISVNLIKNNGILEKFDFFEIAFIDINSYWVYCYRNEMDYKMGQCYKDGIYKIEISKDRDIKLIPYNELKNKNEK